MGEPLQCPTLLSSGYGTHRIEGVGDKHVPWILDVRNMDLVAAIDDELTMRLLRLFNEPRGHTFLSARGVPEELVQKLPLIGISGLANLIGAIKTAKYYEMTGKDIVFSVATDGAALYQSRIASLREERGPYTENQAGADFEASLMSLQIDHVRELTYWEKKRIHHLKDFTWVEQRGKPVEELDRQWYDEGYWQEIYSSDKESDRRIREFNAQTGLLERLG
ncbi:MAG: hypothetical protein ACE5LV_06275 [Candidatus Aminicenantales bacterium]